MKQAAARILEARAQYVQVSADRWPQVGLDYDWDKRRYGGVNVGRERTITTHQLTFPAIFEIDLWSRLAKASAAARNDILVNEENRRTIAQTLVLKPSTCIYRSKPPNADCKSPIRASRPLSAVCSL